MTDTGEGRVWIRKGPLPSTPVQPPLLYVHSPAQANWLCNGGCTHHKPNVTQSNCVCVVPHSVVAVGSFGSKQVSNAGTEDDHTEMTHLAHDDESDDEALTPEEAEALELTRSL